jgi:translation elongation factor EF-1alpha
VSSALPTNDNIDSRDGSVIIRSELNTMTHRTHAHGTIELLRFNTCGSVDDGKSTLIGRLLYDSKSLMEDQLEALQVSADITGGGQINLANLTDGLRAEREQGITIDPSDSILSLAERLAKFLRRAW